MRLTVLGSSGGWPAAGRACSGYLLEADGRQIWLEAGNGTMQELLRHTSLSTLDAVWISHLHPDHCTDLFGAFQALTYGAARDGLLPVYGPPGWAAAFEAFVGPVTGVFEVHELADGMEVRFGKLSLEAVAVPHMLPTFGIRASADDTVLAHTADYETGADLGRFAAGTDVLLAEAWRSSEAVARCAAEHGVPRLVLTHRHPEVAAEDLVEEASRYVTNVGVAETGMVIES